MFRAKVDGFVPQSESVDLRIDRQPCCGRTRSAPYDCCLNRADCLLWSLSLSLSLSPSLSLSILRARACPDGTCTTNGSPSKWEVILQVRDLKDDLTSGMVTATVEGALPHLHLSRNMAPGEKALLVLKRPP